MPKPNRPPAVQLHDQTRGQLGMLVVIFLLGMGVNLLGADKTSSTLIKITSGALLGLHVLVAVGLVVGAILTVRLTTKLPGNYPALARGAGASVGLAIVGGILNVFLKSEWWSYLMAVGFIAAFIIYGLLYVKTRILVATGKPEA